MCQPFHIIWLRVTTRHLWLSTQALAECNAGLELCCSQVLMIYITSCRQTACQNMVEVTQPQAMVLCTVFSALTMPTISEEQGKLVS